MHFDGSYFIVGLLEVVKLGGGGSRALKRGCFNPKTTEKWGTRPKNGGVDWPPRPSPILTGLYHSLSYAWWDVLNISPVLVWRWSIIDCMKFYKPQLSIRWLVHKSKMIKCWCAACLMHKNRTSFTVAPVQRFHRTIGCNINRQVALIQRFTGQSQEPSLLGIPVDVNHCHDNVSHQQKCFHVYPYR